MLPLMLFYELKNLPVNWARNHVQSCFKNAHVAKPSFPKSTMIHSLVTLSAVLWTPVTKATKTCQHFVNFSRRVFLKILGSENSK